MKSKSLLVIFSLFLVQISFAQAISKADIVKFKIKSISRIDDEGKLTVTAFYNDQGDLIKESCPNKDQLFHSDRELLYNGSGQLIEERTHTPDGDINSTAKFYYNDKNQLIKKEAISNGQVNTTWTYDYDANGYKNAETRKSDVTGNAITTYKYDINNLLVQEDKTNSTIGKEERINYQYSANKQLAEKKTRSYYFNTTITQTYLYNSNGKLSKMVEQSSNGVSSTTTYEYNDKDLLISETWESSLSKTPLKITYQINY